MISLLLDAIGSVFALACMFAAVMRFQEVRDAGRMTPELKVLAYPILVGGLIFNALFNAVPVSLILFELPRYKLPTSSAPTEFGPFVAWLRAWLRSCEILTSARLNRHRVQREMHQHIGLPPVNLLARWRQALSTWVLVKWLDPLDPKGRHGARAPIPLTKA